MGSEDLYHRWGIPPRPEEIYFYVSIITDDARGKNKKRQCKHRFPFLFIPLAANLRPFGAPPSKGRRECNSSPASSFRANARNLFRSRSRKDVGAGNGKHRAPCESGSRCFMQTDSRMKKKMANEKDPSAPLGMTIRDNAHPTRLSSRCDANLRPFGPPPSMGRRENAASQTPHEDGL